MATWEDWYVRGGKSLKDRPGMRMLRGVLVCGQRESKEGGVVAIQFLCKYQLRKFPPGE